jgi:hypothetical protein
MAKRETKSPILDPDYQTFLDISVELTGFGKKELSATGMPETYYFTIMKDYDQDEVRAFFKEAQSILNQYDGNPTGLELGIRQRLFPRSTFKRLAQRIILLWYTGIWTSVLDKEEKSEMVSGEAYVQGLIWAAAETHPAGAKQPGFGSWSTKPLA